MFKTRTLATEACKNGKIIVNGTVAKASRILKAGDIIQIKYNYYTKTIFVKDFLSSRVNAASAIKFYDDLTPDDEYNKLKLAKEVIFEYWPKGLGRPTKKNRRIIEKFKNNLK